MVAPRRLTPARKAVRSLIWLVVVFALLFGLNWIGTAVDVLRTSWTPQLALDLAGGTQITLSPVMTNGGKPSQNQLDLAVGIIRERVDASGVAEATVQTEGNNIVVQVPGKLDDATRNRIESSAKLELRAVLGTTAVEDQTVGPSTRPPSPTPTQSLSTTPTATPTNGSDLSWVTPALAAQYRNFDCNTLSSATTNVAPADQPLITCESDASAKTWVAKYALGPVELSGENISNASAGQSTTSQGAALGWVVNITFDSKGTTAFSAVSKRLYTFYNASSSDVRARFAFVLDGKVVSAPAMQAQITDGRAQISGNFTQQSAQELANQLKFGALPLSFSVQSYETIAPTLGTAQLQAGLWAGLIGLILVAIYTLYQYRLLGTVTIASLGIAAALTYAAILILYWRAGFRLSLAGVAGLIVGIGFTADSFIVYFERVRDELREGRPLSVAVETGWRRAFQTVLASKGVNLLAAVVLYILAVGSVKGFALTLGLTTVIDVIIVFLFTHPMLQLLGRTRFFSSGHPLSGLDPNALGAVYRGRAEFRRVERDPAKVGATQREVQRRQTIAERKASERAAGERSTPGKTRNTASPRKGGDA